MPQLVGVGHHYRNAPIIEAILEFRCSLPDRVTCEVLAGVFEARDGYESPTPDMAVDFELHDFDGTETESKARTRQLGFSARRSDGNGVARAHLDRFVFSWTGPYASWVEFLSEAERTWEVYAKHATPVALEEVTVRFVNRLQIPGGQVEIKDYLRTSVDVSPYLPQQLTSLFMQVSIPLDQFDAVATVTSLLTDRENVDTTALVLDISTASEVWLDTGAEGFETELESVLARLHVAKNYVFEACITDATRGLIR